MKDVVQSIKLFSFVKTKKMTWSDGEGLSRGCVKDIWYKAYVITCEFNLFL